MTRPVRVRYRRDGNGWSYVVLAADSLTWLGEGWSAGSKRDAVAAYRGQAERCGWIDADSRSERMRGAA
jgi:hypothetical protein